MADGAGSAGDGCIKIISYKAVDVNESEAGMSCDAV